MSTPRLLRASHPVSPTTAAIAPKAPIGATHMTIASTRKTSFCRYPTPRSSGSPDRPIDWIAKPTSRAASRGGATASLGLRREVRALPAQFVGELQAVAGVQQVSDDQPDGQGHGGHRQEVAEGQAADPTDAGCLPDGADPQ